MLSKKVNCLKHFKDLPLHVILHIYEYFKLNIYVYKKQFGIYLNKPRYAEIETIINYDIGNYEISPCDLRISYENVTYYAFKPKIKIIIDYYEDNLICIQIYNKLKRYIRKYYIGYHDFQWIKKVDKSIKGLGM